MDKQIAGKALVAFFGDGQVDVDGNFIFGTARWMPKDGGDGMLKAVFPPWVSAFGVNPQNFSAQLYAIAVHTITKPEDVTVFASQLLIINNTTGRGRPHDAGLVQRNPFVAFVELLTDGD